jgi:hypothetical protein
MSEYTIVGRSFYLSRLGRGVPSSGDYHGSIVASRDAFFLRIDSRPTSLKHGVATAIVAKALETVSGGLPDVYECDYAQLPSAIVEHPDWPVPRQKGKVIVIPRDSIDRVESDFWGTYDLVCGETIYCLGLNFIGRSKALGALKELGWDQKIDPSKTSSLFVQLALLVGLTLGFLGGGLVGILAGAPWSGPGAVIEYAAIGTMVGLAIGCAIWVSAKRRRG